MTEDVLKFLENSQKLKRTLRHSWTEDPRRQESTAEHTWQMSLMAIIFASRLVNKVNLLRVLKMIAVHDLGEVIIGDTPAFAPDHGFKYDSENKAIKDVSRSLPKAGQKEIIDLYEEYKERKTDEAVFTKMLDVIDVIFQHLVADISTWSKEELTFNLKRNSAEFFEREPFMLEIYNEIHNRLEKKVKEFQIGMRKRNKQNFK